MVSHCFERVESLYSAFSLGSHPSEGNWKMDALNTYIHQNAGHLAIDLSNHNEHAQLYQRLSANPNLSKIIKDIQSIQQNSELLQLAATPDKLVTWLSKQLQLKEASLKSRPEKLLMALETLKKPEYEPVVSKLVIDAFKLETPDQVYSLFEDRDNQLTVLAYLVNEKKIPLKDLNLSLSDLNLMAANLHYVDCRDMAFKDTQEAENFLKNCSNVHHLNINSEKIKKINFNKSKLQTLDCSNCQSLQELDCASSHNLTLLNLSNCQTLQKVNVPFCYALKSLELSNCQALQDISCYNCSSLTKLNCSNFQELKALKCFACTNLIEIDCSNCGALEILYCFRGSNLTKLNFSNCWALQDLHCGNCILLEQLDCSNFQALKRLDFSRCYNLKELELSNCQVLQKVTCYECFNLNALDCSNCGALTELKCNNCTNLRELRLSNCQALQKLFCHTCPMLETIISNGLSHCIELDHSDCPLLSQLPQLSPGADVFSYNSIPFNSFEVDPEDLKSKPLDVLKHLGELILRDKRMPNIVYLNSPSLDAGGLRRQLVTTLMQNPFPNEAYQTIGMLIALAALGSLPLGKVLPNNFYFALLQLDEEPLDEKKIQSLALYGVPDEEIEVVDHNLAQQIFLAAKGFREITDPKAFREIPLNDFITKVAGLEVNWENFDKLATSTDPKMKGYFKTFFEKNPHKIVDVVELITASRALGVETIKIIVDDTLDKERLFVIETCFQQIKLPPYNTYEAFEQKLLKTMEYTSGHFGKA